ncbi:FimB/Mfa2 family fimbrial subunit [Bacteroides helcogenes]|uniref:Lipoprotein n=1 Tax=Bacteroides helcogenes (strain ATCC 35417 / DSM 20613 / JCM 6297 / CCUG 15421 / P 36-108) TaxID=693979 RepID=E6SPQ2_BACT6|nr:FimB/Mfa2 family fimbrial subunit [Bacteroides helcogenes]ADV43893.1 protein of unknown function DUF1812 [Bacteroides helcogenes P 36-108]MDY5237521.1 FimB/Mfa2 family fimbrial subunit [Bacteroides helcogenes]
MKRIFTNIQQSAKSVVLFTVLAGAMASCDTVLDFKEGDCSIEYQVKFKYDYNMKKVDAFAQDVKTVTLYAFGEDGTLVYQKTEEGERLSTGEYAMTVEMAPGDYDLITWGGVDDQSFAVPLLTPGVSTREDLTVLTRRNIDNATRAAGEEGQYVVQHSLPSLFHGRVQRVTFATPTATTRARQQVVTTVPLVKNTNTIRVVIAQVNNTGQAATRAIGKESFSYAIYDDNGYMNYDNSLLSDNLLTYQPYVTESSSVSTRAFSADGTTETSYPAAVAEISVARLLETQSPRLEIIDSDTGKELLPSSNLIGYLSLLKEQGFIDMPLSEYLDREDSFGMIFFVDENLTMIKTVIQINDWIVNINDFEL